MLPTWYSFILNGLVFESIRGTITSERLVDLCLQMSRFATFYPSVSALCVNKDRRSFYRLLSHACLDLERAFSETLDFFRMLRSLDACLFSPSVYIYVYIYTRWEIDAIGRRRVL